MPRLEPLARYEVAGVSVALRGDDRQLARPLLEYLSLLPSGTLRPQLRYDLLLGTRRKRLVLNGRSHYATTTVRDVLAALEMDLYGQVARRSSWTPVHAAGVSLGGRALLLVGDSGAGKSSSALELVRRGAGYLGDEQVFLDHELAAAGLPRGIQLDEEVEAYMPLPSQVAREPLPLALIVFLERERARGGAPQPVPSAEATARLITAVLRPPMPADMATLAQAAARVPVVSLGCEGIAATTDAVEQAFAQASS